MQIWEYEFSMGAEGVHASAALRGRCRGARQPGQLMYEHSESFRNVEWM